MAKTSTERNREWREKHPEEARQGSTERTRKWRAEHPEEHRQRSAEAMRKYRARLKAEKAAAESQAPQNPAKLSDQELASIYQGLKDKGLV